MSNKVRVAIVGVGNCASSLIQGRYYYQDAPEDAFVPGLMHVKLGDYHVRDIEFDSLAAHIGVVTQESYLFHDSIAANLRYAKTAATMEELGRAGTRRVDVICPGFSADCLETLEEIAMENRDTFLGAGGSEYRYIPCLNDSAEHIDMLAGLVERHVQGWDAPADTDELGQRAERARRIGEEF